MNVYRVTYPLIDGRKASFLVLASSGLYAHSLVHEAHPELPGYLDAIAELVTENAGIFHRLS